jgi:hypothetical protein
MENQLVDTNRVFGQIQSLRGFDMGTGTGVDPSRLDRSQNNAVTRSMDRMEAFTDRLTSDLKAAGDRIHNKIERDGLGPSVLQAARGIGNDMKEDFTGAAKRARELGSSLGQSAGEIADSVGSSKFRQEPFSSLAGLAATGLKRAGLYTPQKDGEGLVR